MIVLYTKEGCSACDKKKEEFKSQGIEFKEVEIGTLPVPQLERLEEVYGSSVSLPILEEQ